MHRKPPADPPPGRVRDHGFGAEYGGGMSWRTDECGAEEGDEK